MVRRLDRSIDAPELVIGADTVVTLDGQVYGKPADKQDAFNTISKSVRLTAQELVLTRE